MKGLSKYLAIACLTLPCFAQALQVKDIRMPMTRTEADNTLSKDYNFTILEDASVRREWRASGRRIAIDFDTLTDQPLCVRITYDKPASRAEAEADIEKLCGKLGGKWAKTKKKAVERIGLSDKSLMKALDGGALIFLEGRNKKFTRITYFSKDPKRNRWELQPMSTGGRVTAMGSTSNASAGQATALINDEQRRKDTKPTAVAATPKPKPSETPKPVADKPVTPSTPVAVTPKPTPKPSTPAATPKPKRPAPVAVQTTPSEFSDGEVVETIEEIGLIKPSELKDFGYMDTIFDELSKADGLAAKWAVIKERVPASQLYVGGIILVILILVLWGLIAKMRSKARARANYEKVLANSPQNAAAAPKLTKTTAPAKDTPLPPVPPPPPAPVEEVPAPTTPLQPEAAPAKPAATTPMPREEAPATPAPTTPIKPEAAPATPAPTTPIKPGQ